MGDIMNTLTITNLHVSIDGSPILKGVNLELQKGTVHALMGPNGSGKSTLAHVLMGNPKYTIDKGTIILDGEDITSLPANKRAEKGLFMAFQYPQEITGVTMTNFLRTAYNALHKEKMDVVTFHNHLKQHMNILHMDKTFITRYVNTGFSGGEKKKAEILQLAVLQPQYAILDEPDSGTDVDALKIIADGINTLKQNMGCLLITHYYRILNHITPDKVSIMTDGKIIKTGGKELAKDIEEKGFKQYMETMEAH
jgi:Fe-S cluster assembly ATP-binding protein